jgi:hypothetical protein
MTKDCCVIGLSLAGLFLFGNDGLREEFEAGTFADAELFGAGY